MKLAGLALEWLDQEEALRVRQREELRRAVMRTAEFRHWNAFEPVPVETATKDVTTLAKAGYDALLAEVEEELAAKKTEPKRIQSVLERLRELADDGSWEGPLELSYERTAREGSRLVTRTESVTLEDAEGAREAADGMERQFDSWERVRSQMMEQLEARRRQLEEMRERIPDFARQARTLIGEVLDLRY